MNGIWYHDAAQQSVIEAKVTMLAQAGESVQTVVKPATTFFRGEEYHQCFYQKQGMFVGSAEATCGAAGL